MSALDSPIKWHGGKSYLASKIVALMPPHLHYVEPYAGGLSVLFAKNPEGISEVVNDLSGDLTNFWDVLKDEEQFSLFNRRCEATPFSERDWIAACVMEEHPPAERWLRAWAFFVRCRQSLAGRMDSFAPLSRNRVRRGMNEQASAWLSAIDGLPAVHARTKRVVVLCQPAIKVIEAQDGENTLYYLDPPYLHDTRSTTKEYGEFEMTDEDHSLLLNTLTSIRGKFMLSGYRSVMYDLVAELHGWKRHEFDLPNNAASGKSKKRIIECLWTNF